MRGLIFCAIAMALSCSENKSDSADPLSQCPGNSIYVQVCIGCADDGGCDEMGYECRAICDADEDCPADKVCTDSDEGMYCEEEYICD